MLSATDLAAWIETHPTTVDLVKWAVILALAWFVGLFRFLRNLTRTPRLSISTVLGRAFIANEPHDGHDDAVMVAFLLNIEVANRSSERIVVNSFEVRYRTARRFRRWSHRTSAVTLPSRVRVKAGSGVKIMRNWFGHFPDEIAYLTVDGKIDARDASSGYVLFISHTFGSWNPLIANDKIRVEVSTTLTTGKRVAAKAEIVVTRDGEFIEELVPGLLDHMRQPNTWNVPARF